MIPAKYTCQGDNISPEININNIPKSAKSLALIMDDPDAPSGNFTHWIIWNIPPETDVINENSTPKGSIVGTNSAGSRHYIGPCPPSGTHRYLFKVYALNSMLDLPPTTVVSKLYSNFQKYLIEQGQLLGLYQQPITNK
jgi:Raf kinase inhibitor-like YbhB/YbcL family protein